MSNFIKSAIKHPGAFTAEAKAAGKSVHEYAEEKKHAGGTLGRRARLALTLEGMHHKSMKNKLSGDRKAAVVKMLSSRNPKERDNSPMMAAANKARTKKMKKGY